ncbi:MAG: protein translocase subunit SecD [Bdellovibrionota bacterium]|nr:protein translocase subunit SecD [Pseudobdellovibrionaceae bacterium]|tara:strand:- start:5365 stop:7062 length:1698 start_codon:yes stop_codon:yes gene_type:complete
MIKSLQKRALLILVVVATCIYSLYPNFTEPTEGDSKKRIKYGLDIKGGLHIVMGVDINGVVDQASKRLASTLEQYFKDEKVGVSSVDLTKDEDLDLPFFSVNLSGAGDLEKAEKVISDYYSNVLQVVSAEDSKIELKYLDSYLELTKTRTLEQAIETIRNRVDEFGVAEPSITAQGSDRILIQLPGLKDVSQAKALINKAAFLEFQLVEQQIPPELPTWIDEAEKAGEYTLEKLDSYSKYVAQLNSDLAEKLPKNTKLVFGKLDNAATLKAGKIPYLVSDDASLNGDDLKNASVAYDEFGSPEVNLSFNPVGAKKFADITGANVNRQLAVILDGVVYSAPNIQTRIGGGNARITLGRGADYQKTLDEAKVLSMALRAGALPAQLEQLEERTVGPTLGHDSIEAGKNAILLGGLLVLLFMLFYYKGFGVIANIALVLNILFIFGMLTALDATLTLPGLAGIALTIGMAVDANVIIFERIKEELARGQNYRKAVEDGFGHAFSAIFDANITTGVVCVILMYFGTGPVRGFAVTLLCGLVTSMFTSIFVSRTICDFLFVKLQWKKLAI